MNEIEMIGVAARGKRTVKKMAVGPKEPLARMIALGGLLPICVNCNRIKDDKGGWKKIKGFDINRCNAAISHFICPKCAKKLYPEFYKGKT